MFARIRYKFAVTWVNNCEKWIGPDQGNQPNTLYAKLVAVVKQFRPPDSPGGT